MKLKTFSFIIVAACMYITAFCQVVVKRQSDVGGTGSEVLRNICLSKDGGLLAAGTSDSDTGQYKKANSKGLSDFWIVKYKKDSTKAHYSIQWDKSIGGSDYDYLAMTINTRDNGYLLAGASLSGISGDKTGANFGFEDYWVVKLDSSGNIQWDKTIGSVYSDAIFSVDQTKDGGFILLGSLGLTKLDSNGNVQWQNTNLNAAGTYYSVQQTKNGGYLIGGISYDDGDPGWYPKMIKTDSLGKIRASKVYPSNSFKQYQFNHYSARQTPEGGAILYGLASIDSTKTYLSAADIIKTDAQGNVQWRHTTTNFDSFYYQTDIAIQPTADGGYLFGGTTQNMDVSGGGGQDYRIEKLDAWGNTQWYQLIGGRSEDILSDLKRTGPDRYMIGGYSTSRRGRDKTTKNLGNSDYWIVDVSDTTNYLPAKNKTAITIAAIRERHTMLVYPNPAKGTLHIQTAGKTTIVLTNGEGKTILTKRININDAINVSRLPPGLYYVKNNQTGEVQKLIITR